MKRKTIIRIMALTAALVTAMAGMDTVRGQENDNKETDSIKSGGAHRTVLFDLRLYDFKGATGNRIQRKLRAGLAHLPNCDLLGCGETNGSSCFTNTCVIERGTKAGARRAIYGYVSVVEKTEEKRLGTTGAKKYIMKVEKQKTYHIRLKLLDVQEGVVFAEIGGKSEEDGLDREIGNLVKQLGPFFTERDEIIVEELFGQEEPEIDEEESIPEADTVEGPARERGDGLHWEAAVLFANAVPGGSYRDVASYSAGFLAWGGACNILIPGVEARALLGSTFYSATANEVTSCYSLYGMVMGGYRFEIMPELHVVPLLGFGFQTHFTENSTYSGSRTYTDPLLGLRIGLYYTVFENFFVGLEPGYNIFFESSSTGMYMVLDLGAGCRF